MRSRISGFLGGGEGAGLPLMRLACGAVLIGEAASRVSGVPGSESFIYVALLTPASLAVLTGYRTRIAGAGTAALELSLLALGEGNAVVHWLLATLGATLALIGSGARSVDVRLSGRRRVPIPSRRD